MAGRDEGERKNPRGVLISPGPGTPQDSGKIVRAPYSVMHGKSSFVYYDEDGEDGLFTGLSNLVIEKESFPSDALEITACTEDGLIMAACHKIYRHLQGVQFHPESIITSKGKDDCSKFC